jgi:hypothetical protein
VAGYTSSPTLPGTANAFQPTKAAGFSGNTNVFVAKFDPTGRTLIWSTFLGGDTQDEPTAVAVDSAGAIYVAGNTSSSNYPVQAVITCPGATLLNFNATPITASCTMGASSSNSPVASFLSKISSDGTKLIYSVGISSYMQATALALDSQGEAFLGATNSEGSLFLFRLNTAGSALVYGELLGGGDIGFQSRIAALAVDAQENCYAVGSASTGMPTTPNALQRSNSNANLTPDLGNGFILEVNPTGSQLLYGTWFGPQYFATAITGISINSDGSLYFVGTTNATSFPATAGAYSATPGGGFAGRLTLGATTLSAFSYLPFQSPVDCGMGASTVGQCGTVAMATNSQTQTAYVVFGSGTGGGMVELKLPALGAASPSPSYTLSAQTDFWPSNIAVAAPSSVWIVGWCASCALGNLISANAFQSTPVSAGYTAVLLQLTDVAPTVSFIGSAATGSSPFAAGQLISIYGTQLGPTPGSSAQEGPGGVVTNSNGGTQVLFDGVAAPILYTGASQINTSIPCSVAGKPSTQMVVQYLGAQSTPFTVALSAAAPGIFTVNGTGSGAAVVLNQDYSLNGPRIQRRAPRPSRSTQPASDPLRRASTARRTRAISRWPRFRLSPESETSAPRCSTLDRPPPSYRAWRKSIS